MPPLPDGRNPKSPPLPPPEEMLRSRGPKTPHAPPPAHLLGVRRPLPKEAPPKELMQKRPWSREIMEEAGEVPKVRRKMMLKVKCMTEGCLLTAHGQREEFAGFCCKKCSSSKGGHGWRCQRICRMCLTRMWRMRRCKFEAPKLFVTEKQCYVVIRCNDCLYFVLLFDHGFGRSVTRQAS